MRHLFSIAYLAIGAAQVLPMVDGLRLAFVMAKPLSAWIAAVMMTYIPFLGSGFATYGAAQVWGWNLWLCLAVFNWYLIAGVVAALWDWHQAHQRRIRPHS